MTGKNDLMKTESFSLRRFLTGWEMILVYILIGLNIALMLLENDIYFTRGTIPFVIRSGMPVSIMVLGMTFVLMLGCIDISVGSIMTVSCIVTGLVYGSGAGSALAILCGILAGGVCGAFNGVLTAKLKMPSVIVTIATSMLFRGIAELVLRGEAVDTFPSFFAALAWHDLFDAVPYSMIIFLAFAVIFGIVLEKTRFGRRVRMIGYSPTTAQYSGIRTDAVRIAVFTIMGITAALSGILYAGRLGGITSGMGKGTELQVIAIAVLGGVSTSGGKGGIFGPVIAAFIMAFLSKTLDLIGVHANIQKIITGVILLLVVVIPAVSRYISENRHRTKNGEEKNADA